MALEQQAHQLAGQPFNLGSPKQIGEILFERMKLPVREEDARPGSRRPTRTCCRSSPPTIRCRSCCSSIARSSKLKSTYTDKLPQMVNARTGRVHTTFAQATAVTGRLASNDPNLQNIPVRTAEGRRIREAFIAPPGHVIVSADYSQIELRIMAHLSGDPALLRRVRTKAHDIHRATAAEIFGVPPDGRHHRPAPLHQGGQLRPDLRHERVRPRAAARHRARRGAAVHRQVFRALSRRRRVHAAHARARARARLRRDGVRPPAVAARHQAPAAGRGAQAPSARRSTRRCRAPPPISSSSR